MWILGLPRGRNPQVTMKSWGFRQPKSLARRIFGAAIQGLSTSNNPTDTIYIMCIISISISIYIYIYINMCVCNRLPTGYHWGLLLVLRLTQPSGIGATAHQADSLWDSTCSIMFPSFNSIKQLWTLLQPKSRCDPCSSIRNIEKNIHLQYINTINTTCSWNNQAFSSSYGPFPGAPGLRALVPPPWGRRASGPAGSPADPGREVTSTANRRFQKVGHFLGKISGIIPMR
jgi:hypothetical protein